MARRSALIGVVAGLGLVVLAGCASTGGPDQSALWSYPQSGAETLTSTAADHRRQVARSLAYDRRGLIEDLDLLFLTERSSRLSRWHSR